MRKNINSKIVLISLIAALFTSLCLGGCDIPKKNKENAEAPISITEDDVKKALEDSGTQKADKDSEEKATEKVALKPGAYLNEYEEEMEGEKFTVSEYILFNEDGSGFIIASDDVAMSWNADSIKIDGGSTYSYVAKADKTVEVKEAGSELDARVFTFIGDELPEDVVDSMRLNLDGTEKITNFDAADEFDYIINSDTINFYDYSGAVNYSATESELKDMRAAYIELTDSKYPVLFIESPAAPHAVGYTHVLQYLDKTVYDVAGLDDVREVWKNAGLVSMTYTGGGYGETNYHYYGFDDEGNMIEIASKIVMEDDEYAKDYKTNFGEDFVDEFYIGSYDQSESVTKEDLDTWLWEKTNGEEAISVKWLPLDKAVQL